MSESNQLTLAEVGEIETRANAATEGPWNVFVCDDGKQWNGWPLSINSTVEEDKCVVRPGGFYPYEWDAKTSQHEANQTAEFIAHAREDIPVLCATVRHLLEENERVSEVFKNTCRLHTEWTIDRYLMSNAVNRLDPAEKAQRHIELCQFYVAAVRGCSLEDAMSDYENDFDRLHEESQELTSSLDTEIGFPLDQTPNYTELNPKFFERFHAIACHVLQLEQLK